MAKPGFEEVEHTADWALCVRGVNLEDLLYNAALGMLYLTGVKPGLGPTRERVIEVQAPDNVSLLVAWLEELLFAMETRGVTYTAFKLQVEGGVQLVAHVKETPIETLKKHIKAVTYHNLEIQKTEDGLEATVVFDV